MNAKGQLWVRLGRADHLPRSCMLGRRSPVSGPIWGTQIGAALGQDQTLLIVRVSMELLTWSTCFWRRRPVSTLASAGVARISRGRNIPCHSCSSSEDATLRGLPRSVQPISCNSAAQTVLPPVLKYEGPYEGHPSTTCAQSHRLLAERGVGTTSASGVIPFRNLKRSLPVERTRVVFSAMMDLYDCMVRVNS